MIYTVDAKRIDKVVKVVDRPGFKYLDNIMGVNDYVFGCLAGESNGFNLAHEIAHVIELSPKERKTRFKNGNLTFKVPKVWVINRFCIEPTTDQMCRRELRTMAIQYRIMEKANIVDKQSFLNEILSLFAWLPDYYNFHPGCFDKTPEFERFLEVEFEKELSKHTFESVMKKWNSIPLKDPA